MIYLRDKETKELNLNVSAFSYEFFNYAYLTCKAFIEYRTEEEFTQARFMDDILSSILHKESLTYTFNDVKLELAEAYKIASASIYFTTQETFYYDYLINEEIDILNICFNKIEKINGMVSKGNYKAIEKELKEEIDEYPLQSFYLLIQDLRGFPLNLDKAIYNYYCRLVIGRIRKADARKYKNREYLLEVAKKFISSDQPTFMILVKNIIQLLYETEELDIDGYENKGNFQVLDNYIKTTLNDYLK